ncbi:MAG: PAS domain-containing protein, partial [Capsulimonadaceae bacterium]
IGLITFIDGDRQWFKSRVGLHVCETPRDVAFCSHAILTPDNLMIVPNAITDPRFRMNPFVTGEPNVRFYAGAPLVTSEGHALGTLCVVDLVPREITPEQQRALRVLANQVIAQLELRIRIAEQNVLIEKQRRMEAALKESKDRLRIATASGEIGVWDYDTCTQQLTWDERMLSLYGFTAATFPGAYQAWEARLHVDDKERCLVELDLALRGEKKFDTEFRIVLPNGPIRDIKASAVVISDDSGNPIRMIGINQDITDRKRAENALRDSEHRFRAAIEALHEGFIVTSGGLEIVACNVRAEEILGLTRGQMAGLTARDPRWRTIHEDGTPFPPETYPSAIARRDGKPQYGVVMGIHKPNDELVWVSVDAVPLFRDGEAKAYSVAITLSDITAAH